MLNEPEYTAALAVPAVLRRERNPETDLTSSTDPISVGAYERGLFKHVVLRPAGLCLPIERVRVGTPIDPGVCSAGHRGCTAPRQQIGRPAG